MNHFLAQPERFWRQVGISPCQPRPDVANAKNMIVFAVVGVRDDGLRVDLEIGVDREALQKLTAEQAFFGLHENLMIAFGNLEQRRNCECMVDKPCKQHQPPVPN